MADAERPDGRASDLFVACLEAEGVRYIFGVPGEENEDMLFSLADSTIEFIPCRHEQAAAFMADVWGRLTGDAGVCLATLGPGATNLLTGVADAHLDKAPLVALTAQGDRERLHHESHQLLDVVEIFGPVSRWNTSVRTPEIIPEVVRKAFKLAEMEKPGVTHIELPEDVAGMPRPDLEPLEPRVVRRPSPDPEAIRDAADVLQRAERPLILAGNGAIRKRSSERLTRFAERHGVPVVSTFMGKGAVSDRNPLSLMAAGLGFDDYVDQAFRRADAVLAVGYDIAEVAPESWNGDRHLEIVHLDFEPAEVYAHYHPEVEVVCDITAGLDALDRALTEPLSGGEADVATWYAGIRRQILGDIDSWRLGEDDNLTIPGTLEILRDLMADDGLLISDVGSHKMWVARNFKTYCAGGVLISNGLATMAFALPGAIAAALAQPERQVVAFAGDGGALMNIQDLETAHRLGVDFTLVIVVDDDYGLISWKQERSRGTSTGTRLGNPDFVRLAESFGVRGHRPETPAELRKTLDATLREPGVDVVEVKIDPSVNGELVSRLEDYFEDGGGSS